MAKTKHKIIVTGYEHEDIKSFLNKLKDNEVKLLVDVRELPLSRKKHFSKNSLSDEAEKKKIEYIHFRALGSPRDIRHRLKNKTLSYSDFFVEYRRHLVENKKALLELADMLKDNDVCIMCYEEKTESCHRTIIVDELMKIYPNLRVLAI